MERPVRWWVLVVSGLMFVVFAAGTAAAAMSYDSTPRYEAVTTVMIDQPLAIAAVPAPTVLEKLSRLRLKYLGLLQTDELLLPIAEASGHSRGEVSGALRVGVPGDTLLMRIAAVSSDRDAAETIAKEAADVLVDYAEDEQSAAGIDRDQRFEFRVVTQTTDAKDVRDRSRDLLPLVAAAGGALVSLLILGLAWRQGRDGDLVDG